MPEFTVEELKNIVIYLHGKLKNAFNDDGILKKNFDAKIISVYYILFFKYLFKYHQTNLIQQVAQQEWSQYKNVVEGTDGLPPEDSIDALTQELTQIGFNSEDSIGIGFIKFINLTVWWQKALLFFCQKDILSMVSNILSNFMMKRFVTGTEKYLKDVSLLGSFAGLLFSSGQDSDRNFALEYQSMELEIEIEMMRALSAYQEGASFSAYLEIALMKQRYSQMSSVQRTEEAQRLQEELNTANPENSEKVLGILYAQMPTEERVAEAQRLQGKLNTANQDDSSYKTAEKALGILYAQMSQRERAEEAQRLRRELNTVSSEKALGILYAQMPQRERAEEAQRLQGKLNTANQDDSSYKTAEKALGILYKQMEEQEKKAEAKRLMGQKDFDAYAEKAFLILSCVAMLQNERVAVAQRLQGELNTANPDDSAYKIAEKTLGILYAQMPTEERVAEAQRLQAKLITENPENETDQSVEKVLNMLYAQMSQNERAEEAQRLQGKLNTENPENETDQSVEKVLNMLYAQMPQNERVAEAKKLRKALMLPDPKNYESAKKGLNILYNKMKHNNEIASVFDEISKEVKGIYNSFKEYNNLLLSENQNQSQEELQIVLVKTDDFQNYTVEQQVQYTVEAMYYLEAVSLYLDLEAYKPILMETEAGTAIDSVQKFLFDSLSSMQTSLQQMPMLNETTSNNHAENVLNLSQDSTNTINFATSPLGSQVQTLKQYLKPNFFIKLWYVIKSLWSFDVNQQMNYVQLAMGEIENFQSKYEQRLQNIDNQKIHAEENDILSFRTKNN